MRSNTSMMTSELENMLIKRGGGYRPNARAMTIIQGIVQILAPF